MVGIYDSIEQYYASDDPYRFSYEGFSDYLDYGFGSETSFMNSDFGSGFDPYLNEQLAEQRFAEEDDFGYGVPTDYYGRGDDEAEGKFADDSYMTSKETDPADERTLFKIIQDRLGIGEFLGEETLEIAGAFARAAGLLPNSGDERSQAKRRETIKRGEAKKGERISAARQSINKMAGKSKTAPSGDQYFRQQKVSEMANQVASMYDNTSAGPRGRNIRDPNLKGDISARKYIVTG